MTLPPKFLTYANFHLAFTRIVRAGNKFYKQYYRHLFPSYNLALKNNLEDLIKDIRLGKYKPDNTRLIFQPKQSGILRPIILLPLRDHIVYQAILNIIAEKFEQEQHKYSLKKSYGAIYAGNDSLFFFKGWKRCYQTYNKMVERAFKDGNIYVADFDLVSFYDLIDHNLLRKILENKIDNQELLDLLFKCLESWTTAGAHLKHGVPQGPEPSSFLAECFLFHFDSINYKKVKYFRYIDDIKLMAKDEILLRRALLKLDLTSKELGLVPQAQKIEVRKVNNIDDILKTIPSAIAALTYISPNTAPAQKELMKMFRQSLTKRENEWEIKDITKFKFSIIRLNARKAILNRIEPIIQKRPDCSWVFAKYLKKFQNNRNAADTSENAKTRPNL